MSFIDGFYTFTLDISDSGRGVYERIKTRTARQYNESMEEVNARVLAFAHAYRPLLGFAQGVGESKRPTLEARDITGELLTWIQVGSCERTKLERSLKSNPAAEHRVYFFDQAHADAFCVDLKGSKTNWVAPALFYLLDVEFLQSVAAHVGVRNEWSLTFVDSHLYWAADGREASTEIQVLDVWTAYQELIKNAPHPGERASLNDHPGLGSSRTS